MKHKEYFKRGAVRIALTSGLLRRRVAADLCVGSSTLCKHDLLDSINCRSVIVDHCLVESQASFSGKGYFINQKLCDAIG